MTLYYVFILQLSPYSLYLNVSQPPTQDKRKLSLLPVLHTTEVCTGLWQLDAGVNIDLSCACRTEEKYYILGAVLALSVKIFVMVVLFQPHPPTDHLLQNSRLTALDNRNTGKASPYYLFFPKTSLLHFSCCFLLQKCTKIFLRQTEHAQCVSYWGRGSSVRVSIC